MPLLCRQVLRVPFPPRLVAPSAKMLHQYLDVVRRATTLTQLLKGVPYKGRFAGFRTASAVNDLVGDLKRQWINSVEEIATEKYPRWRELFQEQGRRLPAEMRREFAPPSAWKSEGRHFIEHLLRNLLDASPQPALVETMVKKFDAVLQFTAFVVHAFLTGTYSLQKHDWTSSISSSWCGGARSGDVGIWSGDGGIVTLESQLQFQFHHVHQQSEKSAQQSSPRTARNEPHQAIVEARTRRCHYPDSG